MGEIIIYSGSILISVGEVIVGASLQVLRPAMTISTGIGKESIVSPVSGFPEWLPEQRLVELKWMDDIRAYKARGAIVDEVAVTQSNSWPRRP